MPATTGAGKPKSPVRLVRVLSIIICSIGAIVLLGVVALQLPSVIMRLRPGSMYDQIAKVGAGEATCLYSLDPRVLDDLIEDAEVAAKVTKVDISELTPVPLSDKSYQSLKRLPNLRSISLSYVADSDALLENLQGMKNLEELIFDHASLPPAGARYLITFPNLKRLAFDERTDPAVLLALKGLVTIEELSVYADQLTADQLAVLRTLPNLRSLCLGVEHGVLDLHGLPNLTNLTLAGRAATDAAMSGLEEMENLTDLDLSESMVTDAGLAHLGKNRHLRRLCLSGHLNMNYSPEPSSAAADTGRPVTDAGLKFLEGLTELQNIDLHFTQVTDAGVERLRRALPACNIKRRHDSD